MKYFYCPKIATRKEIFSGTERVIPSSRFGKLTFPNGIEVVYCQSCNAYHAIHESFDELLEKRKNCDRRQQVRCLVVAQM